MDLVAENCRVINLIIENGGIDPCENPWHEKQIWDLQMFQHCQTRSWCYEWIWWCNTKGIRPGDVRHIIGTAHGPETASTLRQNREKRKKRLFDARLCSTAKINNDWYWDGIFSTYQ